MLVEVATGAAALTAAGVMAYGVRAPRSNLIAPSVWRGVADRNSIALTFDDGPSEATPRVLDVLDRFGVRATFFTCGSAVRRLPDIAQEITLWGHEIANHSDTHPMFALRSRSFLLNEIRAAQESIAGATGKRTLLFRPPYGVRWFGLGGILKDLDLTAVMWSVLARDWKTDAATVESRLVERAFPGAILCLHDGRELRPDPDISVTLEALSRAIPRWLERGVRFETVSQILCPTI